MSEVSSWSFLRKGWWLVVLGTVFALGGAALVTVTTTKEYEATALLRVQDPAGTPARAEESLDSQLAGAALARSYAITLDSESFLAQIAPEVGDGSLSEDELSDRIQVEVVGEPGNEVDLVSMSVLAESPGAAVALATEVSTEFAAAVQADGPRAPEISLVAPPVASSDPVSPRVALNLLVGAATGLVIGLGLAWLWARLREARPAPRGRRVTKVARAQNPNPLGPPPQKSEAGREGRAPVP